MYGGHGWRFFLEEESCILSSVLVSDLFSQRWIWGREKIGGDVKGGGGGIVDRGVDGMDGLFSSHRVVLCWCFVVLCCEPLYSSLSLSDVTTLPLPPSPPRRYPDTCQDVDGTDTYEGIDEPFTSHLTIMCSSMSRRAVLLMSCYVLSYTTNPLPATHLTRRPLSPPPRPISTLPNPPARRAQPTPPHQPVTSSSLPIPAREPT